ncbi:hypothetical protein ACJX0J_010308, partial [Zea mays]
MLTSIYFHQFRNFIGIHCMSYKKKLKHFCNLQAFPLHTCYTVLILVPQDIGCFIL